MRTVTSCLIEAVRVADRLKRNCKCNVSAFKVNYQKFIVVTEDDIQFGKDEMKYKKVYHVKGEEDGK